MALSDPWEIQQSRERRIISSICNNSKEKIEYVHEIDNKEKIEYVHEIDNKDYKSLNDKDKKIIDKINSLLKKLSKNGKDYWSSYYG